MKLQRAITSAALYFASEKRQPVPAGWLERTRSVFAKFNLSPILFTADGGGFLLDDCYVLADRGGDISQFGERLLARGSELTQALRRGEIESLGLDSPCPGAKRENWRAAAFVFATSNVFYLGIDSALVHNASDLLLRAYSIARDILDVRYAIAYKSSVADYPDGFASGNVKSSISDVFTMIRHRQEWENRKKTETELWSEELRGERRHLGGLFRGAYPANLLSESHVRSANLLECEIGRLEKLDERVWLWELSDSELAPAERLLQARDVLVSQRTAQ